MTTLEYEKRLQQVDPKFHIKKYGSSMAAIHYGNKHVCRVPQGDIWEYNEYRIEIGFADQYINNFNPTGEYRYKLMTKRGRAEVARILFTEHLITSNDIPKLS